MVLALRTPLGWEELDSPPPPPRWIPRCPLSPRVGVRSLPALSVSVGAPAGNSYTAQFKVPEMPVLICYIASVS